jgi:hypothetical protein
VAAAAVLVIKIPLGFGKPTALVAPTHLDLLPLWNQVVLALANAAATWSKTAFAITLLRITGGRTRCAIWAVILTMNVSSLLCGDRTI